MPAGLVALFPVTRDSEKLLGLWDSMRSEHRVQSRRTIEGRPSHARLLDVQTWRESISPMHPSHTVCGRPVMRCWASASGGACANPRVWQRHHQYATPCQIVYTDLKSFPCAGQTKTQIDRRPPPWRAGPLPTHSSAILQGGAKKPTC